MNISLKGSKNDFKNYLSEFDNSDKMEPLKIREICDDFINGNEMRRLTIISLEREHVCYADLLFLMSPVIEKLTSNGVLDLTKYVDNESKRDWDTSREDKSENKSKNKSEEKEKPHFSPDFSPDFSPSDSYVESLIQIAYGNWENIQAELICDIEFFKFIQPFKIKDGYIRITERIVGFETLCSIIQIAELSEGLCLIDCLRCIVEIEIVKVSQKSESKIINPLDLFNIKLLHHEFSKIIKLISECKNNIGPIMKAFFVKEYPSQLSEISNIKEVKIRCKILRLMYDSAGAYVIKINLKDGKHTKTHDVILFKISEVFDSMLSSGMIESKTRCIELPHIEKSVIKNIINYNFGIIRSDELKFIDLTKMLQFADMYYSESLVNDLYKDIRRFRQDSIKLSEAVKTLMLDCDFGNKCVVIYICYNIIVNSDLGKTDELDVLPKKKLFEIMRWQKGKMI